ncbi:hypothetical protein NL108_003858 [Boleophthalmus pectinirostris]|uniref:thioredoxin-like n=1 Tax=Boleophthalmus pectinirostris TaxID=150288 RepID=UPI000A1C56B7|nr:thioredoxin-like [Boleophthalmus pectinirostris]KAJ0055476.1 hypothetical protein NL108_003858 [Boleophthalmus pectinirostris]
MVKYITSKAEFDAELAAAGDKLLVIDFTAAWCGPCKMIAPVFEKMAADMKDCVFLKVDVDDAEELTAFCEVSSMPTFVFFKNGAQVEKFSGANADKLKETVKKHSKK